MRDIVLNFLFGILIGAGVVCYVGFGFFGSLVFWKEVSGGSVFGLVAALATWAALLCGPFSAYYRWFK